MGCERVDEWREGWRVREECDCCVSQGVNDKLSAYTHRRGRDRGREEGQREREREREGVRDRERDREDER